jgi:glutamate synthase (NADPH) large chain
VLNRLRGRIAVQVDGGLRTGRDVVVGALLGADEFGFSTAPLIVEGCIMMRKCHLNTCPVGVATQDPVLRKRFTGKPEHVVNFFFMIAEEARRLMAKLGFRTFDEMIGRSDRLDMRKAIGHWKAKGLDFTRLLHKPEAGPGVAVYNCERQDHGLDKALDRKLIEQAKPALERGEAVRIETPIATRTGPSARCCPDGSPSATGTRDSRTTPFISPRAGPPGQSLGAWLAHGVTIDLVGEANDYVGKGLSGGRIVVRPRTTARSSRNRTSSSATPCSMARSAASVTSAASPASASRSGIRARSPSSRASAITVAST